MALKSTSRRTTLTAIAGAWAAAALLPLSRTARAQDAFPSKPIRLIVMFPAGGVVDLVGRAVAEKMSGLLGQPIIVENKVGASGTIGFAELARAHPDGYTLAMGLPNMITNPILLPKVTKWKTSDFTGIGQIGAPPNVFVVAASNPARTLKELVDFARANPDRVSVSNPGIGTSNHLGQELFFHRTGLHLQNVMYKGQPEMLPDIASGQVTFGLVTTALAVAQVQRGAFRALAVAAPRRVPVLPDVPTIAEAGFTDATYLPAYGIIGLAGTPREVIAKLSDAMQKAMASPEVIARLEKINTLIVPANAAEYDRLIAAETATLTALIRDRNIRLAE